MKAVAVSTLALSSLLSVSGAHEFRPCGPWIGSFGPRFHHKFVVAPRPPQLPPRWVPSYKPFPPYREQFPSGESLVGFSVDANAAFTPELLTVPPSVQQVESVNEQTGPDNNASTAVHPVTDDLPSAPVTTAPAAMLVVIPTPNDTQPSVDPDSSSSHHPSMRSSGELSPFVDGATLASALLAASLIASTFV